MLKSLKIILNQVKIIKNHLKSFKIKLKSLKMLTYFCMIHQIQVRSLDT